MLQNTLAHSLTQLIKIWLVPVLRKGRALQGMAFWFHHHYHHYQGRVSSWRRCAGGPRSFLRAQSHCSQTGTPDLRNGLSQVSRGLPRGRFQLGDGGWPVRAPTAIFRARWAGTQSGSLTTCPNSAVRRDSMMSVMSGKPERSLITTFRTLSCHLTPSIRLWQRMWKAWRRAASEDNKVQVSEPYSSTEMMHAWYTLNLVDDDSPWELINALYLLPADWNTG